MCLESYGEEGDRKRVGEVKGVSGKVEGGYDYAVTHMFVNTFIFQAKYKESSLKCFTHWGYYMISLPF